MQPTNLEALTDQAVNLHTNNQIDATAMPVDRFESNETAAEQAGEMSLSDIARDSDIQILIESMPAADYAATMAMLRAALALELAA